MNSTHRYVTVGTCVMVHTQYPLNRPSLKQLIRNYVTVERSLVLSADRNENNYYLLKGEIYENNFF